VEQTTLDTDLIERVRDSDGEAFRELFYRYQPILFRYALYRTGQSDLALDVVQECFIRVWEHRSSLNPNLSFLAYILRISGNLILDVVKHRKIRERLDSIIPPPAISEGDDPAEALNLTALQERITSIINQDLAERCRTIFVLSRFEGKSGQEIADLLGLSVKTVESQIGRALKVLRKKLAGYL
jgi:RNA polymerase sigma-70 factor (ECF subfamily)